jgi:hypothetical protein
MDLGYSKPKLKMMDWMTSWVKEILTRLDWLKSLLTDSKKMIKIRINWLTMKMKRKD